MDITALAELQCSLQGESHFKQEKQTLSSITFTYTILDYLLRSVP
jgi:hypothetical protein